MQPIDTLKQMLQNSTNMVFFGGAGVSPESGFPDFRSADGLYAQKWPYPPEEILSHQFFTAHPDLFYQFYREKMLVLSAQPSLPHRALAAWERQGKLKAVVTQNIDGLHQKAGSKQVFELHGSIHQNHCQRCGRSYTGQQVAAMSGVPHCTCGGIIKPNVVLYGEPLSDEVVTGAVRAIAAADLLMVGGTSLTVYPAAGLLQYYRGHQLVLINRSATAADSRADLVLHQNLGDVFTALGMEDISL